MSSRPRLLSTKTVRVQSNPPHVAMVALLDHSVLEDSDELDDWDMQHLIDHHQEDEVVDLDTISRLSSTYTYNNDLLHPFFLLLLGLLDVAAKVMITASSLAALASIPSCDIQLLGSKKMILAGYILGV
ncbi:hypothetical protein NC652_031987 [Populus alba x Populus x berolinensis]|nr:hypothetical protein NC652_031987 [Populus alba x Populus x berolinensis]